MTVTAESAILELNSYASMTIEHSKRQYDKHGTLHDVAKAFLSDTDIWHKPWVPTDFDFGLAHKHPVFEQMSTEQQLAWNHLQWGLEYTVVGQVNAKSSRSTNLQWRNMPMYCQAWLNLNRENALKRLIISLHFKKV